MSSKTNLSENFIDGSSLRYEAENEMSIEMNYPEDAPDLTTDELRQLLHELRVHQIELKMQNEELRRNQIELERARDRYAHLYDFSPVGYVTIGAKGIIEHANLTFAAMVHSDLSSLFGQRISTFIASGDRDIFYAHRQALMEKKTPRECRLRLKGARGDQFCALLGSMLDPGQDDGGVKIRIAVSDITEHKRLEAQARQSHKMEALGTLAGGVAHDVNNILSIILGNTELAAEDLSPDSPVGDFLDEIKVASLRAKDVVRQILEYARKTVQCNVPVMLTPIVRESAKLLRSWIPEEIDVLEDISTDVGLVCIDPGQVNQILINLASNAVQAMPDGGTLKINLRPVDRIDNVNLPLDHEAYDEYALLGVSDTGTGIAHGILQRIFDPYFTTRDPGRGSGMGLSIVHGIVTNHQGAVSVRSAPGNGTTFEIVLPIVDAQPLQILQHDDSLPGGNERILFVDDESAITEVQRNTLERLGYTVEAFTDPLQALSLFETQPHQFDLVISDMSMPQMDGIEFIRKVLQIRNMMPTIICSGYNAKIDARRAKAMGASAYLEKPVSLHELARLVRKVLGG